MNSKIILIILVVVLFASAIAWTITRQTGEEEIIVKDPLNMSYTVEGEVIEFVNGYSEIEIVPNSASKKITQVWEDPFYLDINGDYEKDTVLILTQQTGGSGTFYYLASAIKEGEKYKGTNAIFLGDRIEPKEITVKEDVIVVNYLDRKDNEAMAESPTVEKIKYILLKENKLEELVLSNEFLEVTLPIPYQEIENPILIEGKSSFFEGTTRIRIKDEKNILIDTFAQAEGYLNALYPFSKEIDYTDPMSRQGTIEVFEEDAATAEEKNKIIIPIIFTD